MTVFPREARRNFFGYRPQGYFSPPKLGQKVTREISGRATGYWFKILSRVTYVFTGYFLANLSRVMSRVNLAPKIVTSYLARHGLLFRKLPRVI